MVIAHPLQSVSCFVSQRPIYDLKSSDETKKLCNCCNRTSCPLDRNCNVTNIIYQAEVTTPESKETYIGLCDTTSKERYRNHTCSFRNERYRNVTELSKHIWDLKDRKLSYEIKWSKVKQARSYSSINKNVICVYGRSFS